MHYSKYRAIEDVGRPVLLIKDNRVVGEGRCETMAAGVVGITMVDERAQTLVKEHSYIKGWEKDYPEKKYKWSFFHFSQNSGLYVGGESTPNPTEADYLILHDHYVVDKHNFEYGMVPYHFGDVEGFGSALGKHRE